MTSRRFRRTIHSPRLQIVAATVVMVAGAYLIALWVVGLVLMCGGLLFGLDALFRDAAPVREFRSPKDRWRDAA